MHKKLIKIFTPILLGLSILAHPASVFAADYRDAGIMNKEKGTYVYSSSKYDGVKYESHNVHIAKLNGRLCGAKRPHSVSEQPNFYQSLQSNPYNDSSHPSGGE